MNGCGLVIISVDKLILLQLPDYFAFLFTPRCLARAVMSDLASAPTIPIPALVSAAQSSQAP
jgi:hypothetical protein